MIIDYGYLEKSMIDSLQAIKKHKSTSVLKDYGNIDITYKINFKLIESLINYLKLKSQGITSQRNFLIKLGILERAEIISKNLPFSKKADIYFRLKRLIDKNEMGELFKVMLITNKKNLAKKIRYLSSTAKVKHKWEYIHDDIGYNFVTISSTTISPVDGVYTFSNLKIYEGTYVQYDYTYDSSDVDQRFLIPSANADTSTLKVSVQTSDSDTTTSTYTKATGITSLDSTSKVFFLQEAEDGQFEVYFGDGVIGKKLDDNNIIKLSYVVTNREDANGASSFTLSGNIGGFSNVAITVNSNAASGAEAESNDSIKSYSPSDKLALVIGSEDKGLSKNWLDTDNIRLNINSSGEVDSINASTAAAIAMWELS